MKDAHVPLATHIRGEGDLLVRAIDEVCRLAERLRVPLHVSHFKAVGRQNWGERLNEARSILDRTREKGIPVTMDVYPYTAGSSQLAQLLPPWVQEGGTEKAVRRLRDPSVRKAVTEELQHRNDSYENILASIGWGSILLTGIRSERNRRFIGKTVEEIAAEERVDPYEFAYDLLSEEDFNVAMVDFIMDEEDVISIMRDPWSAIISDSLYSDSGKPHPRVYGAFPEFLSRYVRDRRILPLETAVRKITGFPASVYHLDRKGLILPGYDADLCLFNLNDIATKATYSDPVRLAEGMDLVLVNGKTAVRDGKRTAQCPGKVLKNVRR